MPHRIHLLNQTLGYVIEGTLFTVGLMWTGATRVIAQLIDQKTLDQLRSADGALFGAAVIVVALWVSKIADGKRMDRRHDEMITVLKEGNARSEKLVAESIKAKLLMTASLKALTKQLEGRPCSGGKLLDWDEETMMPVNFDPEELP